MKKKWIEWSTGILCVALLTGGMIWQILTPDEAISKAERRKLDQMPKAAAEAVLSGSFMTDTESWLQDQFPMRQSFRQLKAWTWYHVLQMQDNQGIYLADGHAGKLTGELNESGVTYFLNKINTLKTTLFPQSDTYLAVIPSKNYYLAAPNGYPDMDYETMWSMLEEGVNGIEFRELTNLLEADDYYRTDIHWRQEAITDVAESLLTWMGAENIPDWSSYEENRIPGFYGSYYGQAALPMEGEEIVYLTGTAAEQAVVLHMETNTKTGVYDLAKLTDPRSVDMYDIYLSGADALQVITNPAAKNRKELIVFRDSFGSSLIPLMIESYSKITLIDLRYVNSAVLGQYVNFKGMGRNVPDVLFLYNTEIINDSFILK
ncbi:MAG: hypothetical protein IJ468_04750 [Lachnospiraceae bacterium]|nr:hypothetical protein [Lachnospiraceae bacterium]